MDSLIESITELVLQELKKAQPARLGEVGSVSSSPPGGSGRPLGPRVLVVVGPDDASAENWSAATSSNLRPSALAWSGFSPTRLPATAAGWPVEARDSNWSRVVSDYAGVVLLGADLATLGAIAHLGAGGSAPSGMAIAAVAGGLPVFLDGQGIEAIRRHSARLAPGFVSRMEECARTVSSFGIEIGGPSELASFLARLDGAAASPGQGAPTPSKSGGRDVVTGEDIEAVKKAGQKQILVSMGAIVTPFAKQQAREWGIEVKFQ